MSLTERLANLHLLLRASSFERWPLKVTFYSHDVYRVWEKWTKQQVEKLRPGVLVALDESASSEASKDVVEGSTASGIHALDVGYGPCKPHVDKAQKAFESAEWLHCAVCKGGLPTSGAMALVCPSEGCDALSHIECLSAAFLRSSANSDAIVPTSGQCSSCGSKLHWVDLVKELSLRMRGVDKDFATIYKKRSRTKKQAESAEADADDLPSAANDEIDDLSANDDLDDWHELPDSSDIEDDEHHVRSDPAPMSRSAKFVQQKPAVIVPEPVIEDSDWDDADVIT